MTSRLSHVLADGATVYRTEGVDGLLRGSVRRTRQRLPIELWPPLRYDPVGDADAIVSLHETPSIDLRYTGRFPEQLPRQLAAVEGRILGAAGELYAYDDAAVIGHRPVVGVSGGYFPPSWLGVETAYFIHQEKYLKRNLPLTHSIRNRWDSPGEPVDAGFLLLDERGLEFPAWHHEVLPKLRWLEEYRERTGEQLPLVVPRDVTGFRAESLRLLGYDPDDWIVTTPRPTRFERLFIPPHPRRAKGTHLHTTGEELGWLTERLTAAVDVDPSEFPDRIYISRADADRRHVRNEAAVAEMLAAEGFSWFEPGRLSYRDQIGLFAGADVIVGAHGKGLAPMFLASDATLVELFPAGGATEHYFLTAVECGFEYEFLVGEPVRDGRNVRARDRDLVVDVDALRAIVADR